MKMKYQDIERFNQYLSSHIANLMRGYPSPFDEVTDLMQKTNLYFQRWGGYWMQLATEFVVDCDGFCKFENCVKELDEATRISLY
jgi:hypothetical protein